MSDLNPDASNGACYWRSGNRSEDVFIPCGNSAFGHVNCCQVGDKCLEHGACFNSKYGTTYLAGCTDPLYLDEACPDKRSYRDFPWAGLIFCAPNKWVACEEGGKPKTIRRGDLCECPTDDTKDVAFLAGNRIPDVAWLPTQLGGKLNWLEGHGPTATVPTSAIVETETPTETPTSSTISSPTSPPTDGASRSLTTSQVAGIGIGVAAGTLLIFGGLVYVCLVLRRRKNSKNRAASQEPETAATGSTEKPPGGDPVEMPGSLEARTADPISELPGEPVKASSQTPRHEESPRQDQAPWIATPPPVSPMTASWGSPGPAFWAPRASTPLEEPGHETKIPHQNQEKVQHKEDDQSQDPLETSTERQTEPRQGETGVEAKGN